MAGIPALCEMHTKVLYNDQRRPSAAIGQRPTSGSIQTREAGFFVFTGVGFHPMPFAIRQCPHYRHSAAIGQRPTSGPIQTREAGFSPFTGVGFHPMPGAIRQHPRSWPPSSCAVRHPPTSALPSFRRHRPEADVWIYLNPLRGLAIVICSTQWIPLLHHLLKLLTQITALMVLLLLADIRNHSGHITFAQGQHAIAILPI